MCIYGLNSHLKCSFKNILEKKTRILFPEEPFFCMPYMKCLSKWPYSKKTFLPWKILGCASVTFILTFHPNFHPSIWNFANVSINRKLYQDNIRLVFWKPRMFCLVLFWMRYNIVCTYKYTHYKLWLGLFWRRYILFLFINISIIIFVSVILKKIKVIFIPILFALLQNSQRIQLQ